MDLYPPPEDDTPDSIEGCTSFMPPPRPEHIKEMRALRALRASGEPFTCSKCGAAKFHSRLKGYQCPTCD